MEKYRSHPRIDDILEVIRRWEDVRAKKWLTAEQKEALKDPSTEYTLLINENGEYELVQYEKIPAPENISAFAFERGGSHWVVYWHERGTGEFLLPLRQDDIVVLDCIGGEPVCVKESEGMCALPADKKRYIQSALPGESLREAFQNARVV